MLPVREERPVCFWLAPEAHFIVVCRQQQGHQSTEVLFQEYIPAMSTRTRVARVTGENPSPQRAQRTTQENLWLNSLSSMI
jgi:hypothetical protein